MYPKKLTRAVICEPDYPLVRTNSGLLRGIVTEGTFIFRGVPYAAAERFCMPERFPAWEGIRDARIWGNTSPEIHTDIAHDAYNVPHFYFPQDEKCQYLNIWTQSLSPDAKRPVLVWIHGGGFSTGSGNELFAYDGEELSRFRNVVVVSLNHRLNVLGYLDLSEYGEKYKYSGNCGNADIVFALKWLRENIAYFGGDPENVTIMGQSGGGGKVASLMQTPAADGLYHRAIIQSGILPNRPDISQADARSFSRKLLEVLNIPPEDVDVLQKIPYYQLSRAAVIAAGSERVPAQPVVDQDYYFGSALIHGFRRETLHIPLLVGSVLGEFSNNFNFPICDGYKNAWDREQVDQLLCGKYGQNAQKIAAAFQTAYPERHLADCLFIDSTFRIGCRQYAQARVRAGSAAVYEWLFTLECPVDGGSLPWHNAEEAYMFHNAQYLEATYIPQVSEHLQDIMSTMWANFAETADPNADGLPRWHSLQELPDCTMLFDASVGERVGHDRALMRLLSETYRHQPARAWERDLDLSGGPRQSV